ncbi:GlxA family transcriptional regulator [Actinoplanes derwentensis]|uniref:Transcriptional regulator GlxA family, contains an amidase domain and an AraC-type DNA-binding HTH domain n=1 Tax=Actinoplanes derwentensis TaxID=113562 RepID=A0A1H1VKV5_9ACTN|nr:helix-turn-helix domain-containing protein [Actinoplanes derwentensis]GID83669.1 transcriptional regulator [Actinoplanes derwentensis]SDS85305.1 Transcriptional regulator GlxA family, contains an amidase domain and an AraC-type DNA-binding HTH domain [Actinoplanes derwentensis]
MVRKNPANPHRVAVLALDDVIPFDLGIPSRVFNEAINDQGRRLYEVITCSIGGAPVATSAGYTIGVQHDEQALHTADTVVVATQEPTTRMLRSGSLPPEVSAALALIRPGTRIVSLCTSSFILAAAGLLDGLRATTHWALADEFTRLFPHVDLDPSVLFVDNGRILTSAGAAAGIDLCLHLVRRDHGAAIAGSAARRCVIAPWRDGGQAQFIERVVPRQTDTSTTRTREWALSRLGEPLALTDLAAHANMSVRTFSRRFTAETGSSPNQWLIQQRVDHARHLLETSDLPVDRVAAAVGFGSATLLRRHLQTTLGLPPTAYRKTFRAPGCHQATTP